MRLLKTIPLVVLIAGMAPAWAADSEGDTTTTSCRLIRGAETTEDTTDDVNVCRQDVWFHQATTKAGNAGALGLDGFPSWDTTKPATSAALGAGGGYIASSALHQGGSPWDERASATFKGTFTGDIDSLGLTFYLFPPVEMVRGEPFEVSVRIAVDDKLVHETGAPLELKPGGQAAKKIDFAVTNLYGLLEFEELTGADKEHQITLQVHGAGLGTEAALWVYDTSEVPSGAIFNIDAETIASGGYVVMDAGGA